MEMSKAAADVLAERRRQIEKEGWTPEHDDQHEDGDLAGAAAAYAYAGAIHERRYIKELHGPFTAQMILGGLWPASWDWQWWKPKSRRRDLVRAAALIIAEIERLDRAASREDGE
jgi:hypothetical protein